MLGICLCTRDGFLEVVSKPVSGAGPAREQPHLVLVPKSICHGRRPCAPSGAAPFAVTRYRVLKPLGVVSVLPCFCSWHSCYHLLPQPTSRRFSAARRRRRRVWSRGSRPGSGCWLPGSSSSTRPL